MLVGTLTNILVKKFLGRKFIPRFAKYLIKFPDYIDFLLAPFCSPSWRIVQRHIQILSKCKIFAPARTKKVRKKALISVLSMNLSLKWQYISHMFLVSLCASLRSENDRLIRLWLRCEISMIYTAKFYFNTQANFWMKFSFSSHVKKECKQVLVKKFSE